MKRRQRRNAFVEINITPFTDVVLVLLIIFMISAPILMRSDNIKVHLPDATKASKIKESAGKISLNITDSDDVYLENNKYNLKSNTKELKARLESIKGANKESSIFINGDKNCKYESIVKVIDVANQAGIKHINLGVHLRLR